MVKGAGMIEEERTNPLNFYKRLISNGNDMEAQHDAENH
jgi:hypothetical protein